MANLRIHESTRKRPIDRFERERALLRRPPAIPFDTDEIVPVVVNPHARIAFDGNRYSAPPRFVLKPLTIRDSRDELRLFTKATWSRTRPQLRIASCSVAGALPGGADASPAAASADIGAGIRRLGAGGARVSSRAE